MASSTCTVPGIPAQDGTGSAFQKRRAKRRFWSVFFASSSLFETLPPELLGQRSGASRARRQEAFRELRCSPLFPRGLAHAHRYVVQPCSRNSALPPQKSTNALELSLLASQSPSTRPSQARTKAQERGSLSCPGRNDNIAPVTSHCSYLCGLFGSAT